MSDSFVAVIPDGIDYDIECGLCGYTERNLATDAAAAREAANAHEAACPDRNDTTEVDAQAHA